MVLGRWTEWLLFLLKDCEFVNPDPLIPLPLVRLRVLRIRVYHSTLASSSTLSHRSRPQTPPHTP